MRKLLGTELNVHLKCDEGVVTGLLFDMDEERVYIQRDINTFITIPTCNIKFYVSDTFKNMIETDQDTLPEKQPAQQPTQQSTFNANSNTNLLVVSVDGIIAADIPVPPTMNLANCTNEILEMIWANKQVQEALIGRTQVSLEYDIGHANILTKPSNMTYPSSEPSHENNINLAAEEGCFKINRGDGFVPKSPFEMAKIISEAGK